MRKYTTDLITTFLGDCEPHTVKEIRDYLYKQGFYYIADAALKEAIAANGLIEEFGPDVYCLRSCGE